MFVVVSATPNSHPEYNLQRNTGSTGEEDGAYLFLRSSNIRPQSMFVFVVPATPQQIKQSWSWYSKKNKKQKKMSASSYIQQSSSPVHDTERHLLYVHPKRSPVCRHNGFHMFDEQSTQLFAFRQACRSDVETSILFCFLTMPFHIVFSFLVFALLNCIFSSVQGVGQIKPRIISNSCHLACLFLSGCFFLSLSLSTRTLWSLTSATIAIAARIIKNGFLRYPTTKTGLFPFVRT